LSQKGGNILIKIIMNGCNGHMGRTICDIVSAEKDCDIVAGIDIIESNSTFPVYTNTEDCDMPADVIIDFSTASAVPCILDYAVSKKLPIVICTTGLSDETLIKIDEASKIIPVFRSANMSIGINLIASLLKKAIQTLDDANFDVEIVEKHHNQKIDAPSGTALLLADAVNETMNNKYHYVYDRTSVRQKRDKKELGIHSVRGGTIVGEHSVIFAGKDEVIEFRHTAMSKEIFAVGAVKAAKFIVGKPHGKYDMQDVME